MHRGDVASQCSVARLSRIEWLVKFAGTAATHQDCLAQACTGRLNHHYDLTVF